jgi:hypothetical protein
MVDQDLTSVPLPDLLKKFMQFPQVNDDNIRQLIAINSMIYTIIQSTGMCRNLVTLAVLVCSKQIISEAISIIPLPAYNNYGT